MCTKNFRTGTLVWAKMKGFPSWPAKVSEPRKPPHAKKYHHYVYFFGTKNFAWILDEHITRHSTTVLECHQDKKMSPALRAAIEEIVEAEKDVMPGGEEGEKSEDEESRDEAGPSIATKLTMKYKKLKESKRKKPPQFKKRFFGCRHIPNLPSTSRQRKPKVSVSPYDEDLPVPSTSKAKHVQPSTVLHVPPTDKRIGFLGLGAMGSRIATVLLKSGHKLTVWDRNTDRCDDLVRAGARRGETPADVVAACDITFCCVSDPEASKMLVFGMFGVLQGLDGSTTKGYVEMSSIDEKTSQEISEAVINEGARYLEAPIGGTTQLAEEGELIVYGSGDRELFHECETCFHAISKHAYYISAEVGPGSNTSLISSMLVGTTNAALGEALALADRCSVSKDDMLDIARMVGLSCPLVMEKRKQQNDLQLIQPSLSLKNQQKDLHLSLQLSDTKEQPMPVTSAANELYKHARRLGYNERDAAAVFHATKF